MKGQKYIYKNIYIYKNKGYGGMICHIYKMNDAIYKTKKNYKYDNICVNAAIKWSLDMIRIITIKWDVRLHQEPIYEGIVNK